MQKLYMIGNTHFDPVWLWKWDESMASIRATFRSALDRMKEDENFIYSFATPPVFEWIKNTDPEMFSEIKERIREGRWELAEGWWVQPDCYGASGESYVRQGLYGQKYLMENFGKYSDGMFQIDSFGHNPQLPQILSKSHIKYYSFVRPEKHHYTLEKPMFWWHGIDGSRILTYRATECYAKTVEDAVKVQPNQEDDLMIVYGVTDHGGAPTKKLIAEIHEREDAVFSSVSDFFQSQEDQCTYHLEGDLLTGDFGPYSNYLKIKQMNRKAEFAVQNAEMSSVIAGRYHKKALESCWHDVLFNQFHDILGGASIKEAYFDAENSLGRAIITANEMMHFNLQNVTKDIKTVGKNPDTIWNLAVWNLNGAPYHDYVETEVQWAHEFDWYDKGIALEDEDGNRYPCQVIAAKAVIPRFRSRFVFKAEIPAAGYKMFKVVQTGEELVKNEVNPNHIITEQLEIRFSEETGCIESVNDRATGEKLADCLIVPVCYYDDGDTWCFNIKEYDKKRIPLVSDKVQVVEAGELRTIIKRTYRYNDSKIDLYYTFYTDTRSFDVSYRVNWNEKHYALKLESLRKENKHIASIPYGKIQRGEVGADVPTSGWVKSDGVSFVTDGIFSYNMREKVLGFTVLRSPIFGDLRLSELDYEEEFDMMSQGISEGKIRVDFTGGEAKETQNFLNPPVVICESNHDGVLPCENSYYSVAGGSVIIGTVKQCEYDDCDVVRLVETDGKACEAKLTVRNNEYMISMKPFEIKTLKVNEAAVEEIFMTEELQ